MFRAFIHFALIADALCLYASMNTPYSRARNPSALRIPRPSLQRQTNRRNPACRLFRRQVNRGFRFISTTAPQLPKTERWVALVRYIIAQFLASKTRKPCFLALPNQNVMANSG
jgi:hypothetical protein